MTTTASLSDPLVESVISSILNLFHSSTLPTSDNTHTFAINQLRHILSSASNISYKRWSLLNPIAATLNNITFTSSETNDNHNDMDRWWMPLFKRLLRDGKWKESSQYAFEKMRIHSRSHFQHQSSPYQPWLVLITGLNGIRKTTCLAQPWFSLLLSSSFLTSTSYSPDDLPAASNSFFRQLDHILATVVNKEFHSLYQSMDYTNYKKIKETIYLKYRLFAEIFGFCTVFEAQKQGMNILIETSGRDSAMFECIDYLADTYNSHQRSSTSPNIKYRKLLIHFSINDIKYAKESVDKRMIEEMQRGKLLLQVAETISGQQVSEINSGGPYAGDKLDQVFIESEDIWKRILVNINPSTPSPSSSKANIVGSDWDVAHIEIIGNDDDSIWIARPALSSHSSSMSFIF